MRDPILSEIIGLPAQTEVPYDSLMPRRVGNLLLVSSLYDCYAFIEDGRLSEMLFSDLLDFDVQSAPSIHRVSTAGEALEIVQAEPFDLVISTARVGDMNVQEFGQMVKSVVPDLPVVLLTGNARELSVLPALETLTGVDTVFVWLGDVRLFPAIIQHIEDRENAWHDARTADVKSIILIEDSVQFYSSYLPMLYTEILKQTRELTADSVNRAQRIMRMRARPKVLLARTYEEGLELYERYRNDLLGVILDAAFPREGKADPAAGFRFARLLRERAPALPVLMQSEPANAVRAASLEIDFIDKSSPTLLSSLRTFMKSQLGFGDFVFLGPGGEVISRAPDLRTLDWAIQALPEADLPGNVERNDFHMWLMARAEFELAKTVRNVIEKTRHDPSVLRRQLLQTLRSYRERSMAGVIAEYSTRTFEGGSGFVRIGKGSLGGKGRGLAFVHSLIDAYRFEHHFPGVRIFVPPTAVLATGIFDQFMESSGLLPYALEETDDEKITDAFLEAELPREVVENLWTFLQWVRYPLAVRSSSLLEDASYQPFAGIYKTYMIPNNNESSEVRLEELRRAIKMVYASTYHSDPKAYMESVPNRLEEEKMAVIIQQVVGRRHDSYLYPDFAGVGRSLNFYPMPEMRPEDGVVSVALGLGKTVVEGGRCVRFCPACPRKPIQSFTPEEYVENSQKSFLALNLAAPGDPSRVNGSPAGEPVSLALDLAESHGTLGPVGSVFSNEENAVFDGLSRRGIRIVTMAGVLKGKAFPLPEVMAFLLKVGAAASSSPVEIEFAVNLSGTPDKPHEFGFLQIRPLVLGAESRQVQINGISPEDAICISHKALGNGLIQGICDVVYVRRKTFDRGATPKIADEVGSLNTKLKGRKRPYLLIGPGRWGSADPWLGIPVKWAQISGVRCIIETDLEDIRVEPSQGSHFFQNIVSFGIGYLTVDPRGNEDVLDTRWLDDQPSETETEHLRHVAFEDPVRIALDGRKNFGVVMKPGDGDLS
jgi:CheY-like chemotaxis protein